MVLTNEIIVGIVTLLTMCFLPGLGFLIRTIHRRKKQQANESITIPLEPIPKLNDLDSLENGFLYTAVSASLPCMRNC